MSMSRNFLFHLLQDNQITLSKDYECTIKPQLYLINLPIFEAVPNIAYQNEVYKLQEAHLSIFSIYDKKERIPEFSVSHATLTFKVAPYANAQLKVRVYLDMGGQPQAVGGKYCTAKFITPRSPKGATFILNKSAEADLVQAALSLSNEIVDSVYNACEKLIEAKQKAIDNILEELNTLEDPAERYPLLKSLENECEWSEKYRPFDSTRKYNIYLKNFVRSELHAIENGKKERGKVAQSQLPIEPSASSTSSSSVIPVLPPTARAQAAVKPQRHKRDKALKEIKEGRRNLEAARKKMEENRCFQTIYSFWKNISIQLEMESSQLDVKQIFGLATRAKKIRLELENFLGEAFYHYEVGQDEPDELKQFLKLPFPD
ncbi:MAG: hypothetical protein K0R48_468, partial [Gammaproteobacteria bacterium]|nr:hypothetical protein [Gammaproteobacteria bacterium]